MKRNSKGTRKKTRKSGGRKEGITGEVSGRGRKQKKHGKGERKEVSRRKKRRILD